jgi:hypothetical protein
MRPEFIDESAVILFSAMTEDGRRFQPESCSSASDE